MTLLSLHAPRDLPVSCQPYDDRSRQAAAAMSTLHDVLVQHDPHARVSLNGMPPSSIDCLPGLADLGLPPDSVTLFVNDPITVDAVATELGLVRLPGYVCGSPAGIKMAASVRTIAPVGR